MLREAVRTLKSTISFGLRYYVYQPSAQFCLLNCPISIKNMIPRSSIISMDYSYYRVLRLSSQRRVAFFSRIYVQLVPDQLLEFLRRRQFLTTDFLRRCFTKGKWTTSDTSLTTPGLMDRLAGDRWDPIDKHLHSTLTLAMPSFYVL